MGEFQTIEVRRDEMGTYDPWHLDKVRKIIRTNVPIGDYFRSFSCYVIVMPLLDNNNRFLINLLITTNMAATSLSFESPAIDSKSSITE